MHVDDEFGKASIGQSQSCLSSACSAAALVGCDAALHGSMLLQIRLQIHACAVGYLTRVDRSCAPACMYDVCMAVVQVECATVFYPHHDSFQCEI